MPDLLSSKCPFLASIVGGGIRSGKLLAIMRIRVKIEGHREWKNRETHVLNMGSYLGASLLRGEAGARR